VRTANLDIDLLRSFAAVADTRSFTAAAELVARTQSAVSVQIKRLEEIVGRRVFERTSRSLALTPEGETLLGYARRILELNDESVRRIIEPPVAGEIRLGITEYLVPNELPQILARFAAAYPGVRLEVRMGLSRALREELEDAEVRRRDRPARPRRTRTRDLERTAGLGGARRIRNHAARCASAGAAARPVRTARTRA
jgi:DNA-binding transcriptional LysR family regulator